MDNMEHAIEQAARIIDPDGWRLRDSGRLPYDHPGAQAVVRRSLDTARELAEAGLLAPEPLREEWGIQWDDGVWEYYRNRAEAEAGAGDEGTPVHRYVSDWMPADSTEGDGRADQ